MLVKVEELRAGDEILVPSSSNLRYVKLLNDPKPHPIRTKSDGSPIYKAVRCSIKNEPEVIPANKWRKEWIRNKYVFEPNVALHNTKISVDLNWKQLWLVKRENP